MRILLDRPAPGGLGGLIDRIAPDCADVTDVGRDDPDFAAHLGDAEVVLHVLDPITAIDPLTRPEPTLGRSLDRWFAMLEPHAPTSGATP